MWWNAYQSWSKQSAWGLVRSGMYCRECASTWCLTCTLRAPAVISAMPRAALNRMFRINAQTTALDTAENCWKQYVSLLRFRPVANYFNCRVRFCKDMNRRSLSAFVGQTRQRKENWTGWKLDICELHVINMSHALGWYVAHSKTQSWKKEAWWEGCIGHTCHLLKRHLHLPAGRDFWALVTVTFSFASQPCRWKRGPLQCPANNAPWDVVCELARNNLCRILLREQGCLTNTSRVTSAWQAGGIKQSYFLTSTTRHLFCYRWCVTRHR